MRPQDDPARRCLHVREWPAIDRQLWKAATENDDLFSPAGGDAGHWRPATREKNRKGYGRWLTHLRNCGANLGSHPTDRVSLDQLRLYHTELKTDGLKPYTIRNRFNELAAVIKAFGPDRDWAWLVNLNWKLDQAAQAVHDTSLPPLLAAMIINRAKLELHWLVQMPACRRKFVVYRDWLILLVGILLPLRRGNLANLSINRHLRRTGNGWIVNIPSSETKNKKPYSGTLPREIDRFLDHWLTQYRPIMSAAPSADKESDALWLTQSGEALSAHTLALRMVSLTKRAFGDPISPHELRCIFATTISIEKPELIETARVTLGHSTTKTTQEHYNRANALQAGREQAKLIAKMRG